MMNQRRVLQECFIKIHIPEFKSDFILNAGHVMCWLGYDVRPEAITPTLRHSPAQQKTMAT